MANIENANPKEDNIQGLLGRYLNLRSRAGDLSTSHVDHLNEDTLSAFTEGNLNQREATPIVNHLVNCSFCRHVTSELVRLDLAFADTVEVRAPITDAEPAKISAVLNGILSRIFGTRDGAVFAHNEEDEDKKREESKEDEDKDEK